MKILVSSDIHVGDYQTYNPTQYFRLNQFNKLSELLVEVCKRNSIEEFWIAGDLLQIGRPAPIVMYTLKKFLRRFAENGVKVRAILGNHDVTVRSENTDVSQYDKYSLVSLLRDTDVEIYLDDIVEIAGKKVHFKSWVPTNNFEYKDADILVAHGDVSPKLSPFSQNYIDISKYQRAFVGHIHIPYDSEIFVSPGTPIQHSYSDDINTSVIIYDTDTNLYNRLPITGFLRFEYVDSEAEREERSEEVKDEDVIVRVRPKVKDIKFDMSESDLSVLGILDEYLTDLNKHEFGEESENFVRNVMKNVDTSDISFPDLSFKLKTLKATDFLSIKKIDFNFEDYHGLNVIEGHIGSGKSTLFRLIQYMFFGKNPGFSKSDYSMVFKEGKKFKGELTLEYKGHTYTIKRKLSDLTFIEDSQVLEGESIRARQEILEKKLSFLKFYSLIYIEQTSNGIFSDMSDTSRVSFLSELCGMNYIRTLTDTVQTEISNKESELALKENIISQKQGSINSLNSFIELNKGIELKDESTILDQISELERKTESANSTVGVLKSSKQSITQIISQNDREKARENSLKASKENLLKDISILRQKNQKISEYLTKYKIIDVQEKMDDLSNSLRDLDAKILECNSNKSVLQSSLSKLKAHPDKCPHCGQDWKIPNLEEQITQYETDIEKINESQSILTKEKDNILSEFNNVKVYADTNAKIMTYQSEYNNNVNNIDSLLLRIESIDTDLKNIAIQDVPDSTAIDAELEKYSMALQVLNNRKSELLKEVGSIKMNNDIFYNVQKQMKERDDLLKEIQTTISFVQNQRNILECVQQFNNKVLSDKGMLVASLLKKIAEKFNADENLKVETVTELQNGSIRPTLNLKLFVEKYQKYVDYNMLSGGQKLQADIRFLCGLTIMLGNVSTFFMDEIFKYMDDVSIIELSELLKELNTDKVFLVLHGNLQGSVADRVIHCQLTENGSIYS